jgi:hypothetical protein
MKKRLAEVWDRYRETVMSADASAVQVIETRRGFYAGAEAMLQIQNAAYDGSTPDPTDDDLQVITDLHNELQEFAKRVEDGVA